MSSNFLKTFMSKAVHIGSSNPRAPYGAVLVYNDTDVLLTSVNSTQNNPLMHGELSVIYNLFNDGFKGDIKKLSLYTTAEPCPMCAAAIYWAMIPKVVYGTSISFLHHLFGRQIQISAKEVLSKTPDFYHCDLIGGILENECNSLFIEAKRLREC